MNFHEEICRRFRSAYWPCLTIGITILVTTTVHSLRCHVSFPTFDFVGCSKAPLNGIELAAIPVVTLAFVSAFVFSLKRHLVPAATLFLSVLVPVVLIDARVLGGASRTLWGALRGMLILGIAVFVFLQSRRRNHTLLQAKEIELTSEGLFKALVLCLPLYLAVLTLYTLPMLRDFKTHYFADGGDGMQMVWNVWWLNKAVLSFTNPFYTSYLHFPLGSTLLGASYHPLKSLFAVPLIPILGLLESYNVLVLWTFVACALSAFALTYLLTKNFLGSFLSGFLFAFWGNRFAHANGHLHVMSAESIPLFLGALLFLFSSPSKLQGMVTALILFISLLFDHYSFLSNLFILGVVGAWRLKHYGFTITKMSPVTRNAWIAFFFTSLVTSGAYLFAMIYQNHTDPWSGAHGATDNSMDLFALFIPGAFTRWGVLASAYWRSIKSGPIEGSVYAGISGLVLAAWGHRSMQTGTLRSVRGLVSAILVFFFILALGPYLQICGWETPFSLPYHFLQKAVPPLRMSGVPVRLSVVVILMLGILGAFKIREWQSRSKILFGILFSFILLLDLFPLLPTRTENKVPEAILFLKHNVEEGAVIDADSFMTTALFHQTVYEKPMAFGYIARVPRSRVELESTLRAILAKGDYHKLRERYGFRYLLKNASPILTHDHLHPIFGNSQHRIYEID